MSYTPYWAIFNRWYIAYTLLYIRHSPCTCRIHGIGPYSTGDTYPVHFYTSDIHPVHVVYPVLGHIQPLIHSLYTFIHQTFTQHMSYTRYWAIFNLWYIAYTLLCIRHSPCTCRIHGIGSYSTGDTYPVHFYTSDIHPVHVVYMVLGHIQPVIHTLCTFIHQTYTRYMSYTRYWAIFNRWYIAYTLLYIRHSPCTCRIHGIGPYSTGDTYHVHFHTSDIHPVHVVYAVLGHIQPLIHRPVHFYTSDIHPAHVVYTVLGHIQPVIHTLYSYTSDIHSVHVVYAVLGHIQPVIHSLYFYTSDIHPVHVVYMVLGHIQPVIHSLYTFKHQTYTLYMSYTRYWSIFNRWYMACTVFYISYTSCTCRLCGIGPYTNGDTWPVHINTSDIHPVHVVYAVLGHIQPVIHSLYTFKHQTYTLYMSYTRYWSIFNRWYMACTLLYIRYTSCTCRLCGIGPYTNGDTWPVHINTSDIHPVHVVYVVLVHIQPVIHNLYTFIHQTYTLYMS